MDEKVEENAERAERCEQRLAHLASRCVSGIVALVIFVCTRRSVAVETIEECIVV